MRVLLVCGTGFIGRHVALALDRAGHEVTVFHRGVQEGDLPRSVRHVRHPWAEIPVTRFPPEALRVEPEVVVHVVPIGERDAEVAVRAFRGVARRLVALSSGDVYRAYGLLAGTEETEAVGAGASAVEAGGSAGRDRGEGGEATPAVRPLGEAAPLLGEDAPLRTTLYPYGREAPGPWGPLRDYEKILVERVVLAEPGLTGTVLRLPKVYGPGDRQRTLLPYLKRMDDGRTAILLGVRQARWRWTHGYVEDVAAAVALAAADDRAAGRVYNVGEQMTPTVAERVRRLGRAVGWVGEVVVWPDDRLPPHLRLPFAAFPDLAYDTARIRAELGYAETIETREGLRRTMAWERSNPPERLDRAAFDYAAEDSALAGRRWTSAATTSGIPST